MCLAVPTKILSIDEQKATVEIGGVQRTISLTLTPEAQVGDYVIVHAGFALHKIEEVAALESLRILKEAASFAEEQSNDSPDSS